MWVACPLAALGQRPPADSPAIGIEGHYRVGRWTAVRLDRPASDWSIETRDGDGVQVVYQQPDSASDRTWGYAIPGSEAAPLIVRSGPQVIATTRFPELGSPARGSAMIPRHMPWIVALGDPLGVDQIGANPLLGRDPQIAVSMPGQANGFPDSALGYDGVDMLLLSGSSIPLLQALGAEQCQAIADWITAGGRVLLTLGESAPELLKAAPWLAALLPGQASQITTARIVPSAIETFTSSQTPLEPFVGASLPKDSGRILILGRTTRRLSSPVAVEYNVGFGRITVVAADLDREAFAQWPERIDLITQLTGTILVPAQGEPQRKSRVTAYDDLAGQLRTTLDQFAIKRSFGFSLVSLIVMALIAAIGPLDYLLVNRVLGRPLLGWLTFPIVAIGLSLLLAFQSRPVAQAGAAADRSGLGSTMMGNRIEIFDIDALARIGRGCSVAYLYAHEATRLDVEVRPTESLSQVSAGIEQMLTTPFGYPGESFGGIQIAIEDARLPTYQAPVLRDDVTTGRLTGLPLAARSSKGIQTRCRFQPRLAADASLGHRAGSELLQGQLVNPLPFDLLDGMLIYRNWTYLLPTRFRAGERIARVDTLRQKNFRWQLARQKALGSATETEAWDPARQDSPLRISEMLMFHQAAGGSRYTSLQDGPLSFLDLSHVLAEDRCILVGRLSEPFTTVQASDSGQTRPVAGDTLTWIRVVLPVDHSRR
jgi:hypothetical protein